MQVRGGKNAREVVYSTPQTTQKKHTGGFAFSKNAREIAAREKNPRMRVRVPRKCTRSSFACQKMHA